MKKLLLLIALPFSVAAQKNSTQQLEQYVEAQNKIKGFSGSVLVVQKNKILLNKGYGFADIEWSIPNSPSSKFRIGSLTKQFTAACILQLIEQGKLSLTDKLSKFYPDFPKGDSVTIYMLLNHTSGIASYTDQSDFGAVARLSWPRDSMISYFKNRPYNFSPGTGWKYNNSGYFLLGCIIEKVSGETYAAYVRKHIFEPLGMLNTGTDSNNAILANKAQGYEKAGPKFVSADWIAMEWPFSAGVIYSTTEDLYKWDRALYGNKIISEASKKSMFTPGKSNYGFGIIIDSLEKHFRIWHNGGIPGFVSNFSRYVNDDLCIIVLSNDAFNSDGVADGLAGILFGAKVEFPYEHKEVKIDTAILSRYIGKYNAFLTINVIKKDGKLYRHRDGTPDIELKPESETKFFYADDSDRQLEFEVDANGKVTKIWFINNGNRGEMKKVE
ncbi:MAG: serine hydrolase [Bacteroidetes bacterium]|nr:MAG: serine hydrolase [Bacteroidota bacterium]